MGRPQPFDFGRESRRYLVDQFGEEVVTTFEYAAWKAVNRASRWPSDETAVRVRQAIWEGCPHDGKYGDDGERQCHGTDFLRDDLDRLLDHVETARNPLAALHGREETVR